jgi:predicted dehydrogenase
MTMQALIIGYGRAGQRHARLLDELGIDWIIFDPYVDLPNGNQMKGELDQVLRHKFDMAVIATPPDQHLSQLDLCLQAGLKVMVEKPLCALDQFDEAVQLKSERVMVAYNYRYHPALQPLRGMLPTSLICSQARQLPPWGLLLDHVSHDLDILRFLSSNRLSITRSNYRKLPDQTEMWQVVVRHNYRLCLINEAVYQSPCDRQARLHYGSAMEADQRVVDIHPAISMFTAMWHAFLADEFEDSYQDALVTQTLLNQVDQRRN